MASFLGSMAQSMGKGLLQYGATMQQGKLEQLRQNSIEKRWKRQDAIEAQDRLLAAQDRAATIAFREKQLKADSDFKNSQLAITKQNANTQAAMQKDLATHRDETLAETTRHNKAMETLQSEKYQASIAKASKDHNMSHEDVTKEVLRIYQNMEDTYTELASDPANLDGLPEKPTMTMAFARFDEAQFRAKGGKISPTEEAFLKKNMPGQYDLLSFDEKRRHLDNYYAAINRNKQ